MRNVQVAHILDVNHMKILKLTKRLEKTEVYVNFDNVESFETNEPTWKGSRLIFSLDSVLDVNEDIEYILKMLNKLIKNEN